MTEHHEGHVELSGAGNELPKTDFVIDDEFIAGISERVDRFNEQLDELRARYGMPWHLFAGLLNSFVTPVGDFYAYWAQEKEKARDNAGK